MLTNDDYRQLLKRPDMSDKEVTEFRTDLEIFLNEVLDEYFLQAKARQHNGIDYLQVFEDASKPEPLWFIEDDVGGAITVLLPSDY
jgi:hypothetical protein